MFSLLARLTFGGLVLVCIEANFAINIVKYLNTHYAGFYTFCTRFAPLEPQKFSKQS